MDSLHESLSRLSEKQSEMRHTFSVVMDQVVKLERQEAAMVKDMKRLQEKCTDLESLRGRVHRMHTFFNRQCLFPLVLNEFCALLYQSGAPRCFWQSAPGTPILNFIKLLEKSAMHQCHFGPRNQSN